METNDSDAMSVPDKIMAMLSDGKPHSREELKTCLWDEMSEITVIQAHISKLRKPLRKRGEEESVGMPKTVYRIAGIHKDAVVNNSKVAMFVDLEEV